MPRAITEVEQHNQDDYVWLAFIIVVVVVIFILGLVIVYRIANGKVSPSNLKCAVYIICIDIALVLLYFGSSEVYFLALIIYLIYLHYCHNKGYM